MTLGTLGFSRSENHALLFVVICNAQVANRSSLFEECIFVQIQLNECSYKCLNDRVADDRVMLRT
ncbi:hypothetical protein A9264_03180 [Vibrio sp. UCD-FRSSP16_10]|nr:hypothetical protein A9260_04630 [Vibrio sp. UCD-FRSSP16_30]OBT20486.1 hypothetical protein A9264_03180 [Vibrio sp. UCD-FRSSP16_10]